MNGLDPNQNQWQAQGNASLATNPPPVVADPHFQHRAPPVQQLPPPTQGQYYDPPQSVPNMASSEQVMMQQIMQLQQQMQQTQQLMQKEQQRVQQLKAHMEQPQQQMPQMLPMQQNTKVYPMAPHNLQQLIEQWPYGQQTTNSAVQPDRWPQTQSGYLAPRNVPQPQYHGNFQQQNQRPLMAMRMHQQNGPVMFSPTQQQDAPRQPQRAPPQTKWNLQAVEFVPQSVVKAQCSLLMQQQYVSMTPPPTEQQAQQRQQQAPPQWQWNVNAPEFIPKKIVKETHLSNSSEPGSEDEASTPEQGSSMEGNKTTTPTPVELEELAVDATPFLSRHDLDEAPSTLSSGTGSEEEEETSTPEQSSSIEMKKTTPPSAELEELAVEASPERLQDVISLGAPANESFASREEQTEHVLDRVTTPDNSVEEDSVEQEECPSKEVVTEESREELTEEATPETLQDAISMGDSPNESFASREEETGHVLDRVITPDNSSVKEEILSESIDDQEKELTLENSEEPQGVTLEPSTEEPSASSERKASSTEEDIIQSTFLYQHSSQEPTSSMEEDSFEQEDCPSKDAVPEESSEKEKEQKEAAEQLTMKLKAEREKTDSAALEEPSAVDSRQNTRKKMSIVEWDFQKNNLVPPLMTRSISLPNFDPTTGQFITSGRRSSKPTPKSFDASPACRILFWRRFVFIDRRLIFLN